MKSITLSINPLYLCNFSCSFCYLTPEQLRDKKRLDLNQLSSIIKQVKNAGHHIDHVDLYGGEIALLDLAYLEQLDDVIYHEADDPSLNIITNFSRKHEFFMRDHVDLSVSFDFEARERHEQVLANIISTNKDIAILMLASPELLKLDVDHMIKTFNRIQNIKSVEIKPYSSNQANKFNVTDKEFEDFVFKWLYSSEQMNFTFLNKENIGLALSGKRNAFSDDHIYINPNGKIAVLEFDDHDHEFFLELNDFQQYLAWTRIEHERVQSNSICSSCKYLGRCLTEHYRPVQNLENSCNGYINLLAAYDEGANWVNLT